jgi:hypothetical protein
MRVGHTLSGRLTQLSCRRSAVHTSMHLATFSVVTRAVVAAVLTRGTADAAPLVSNIMQCTRRRIRPASGRALAPPADKRIAKVPGRGPRMIVSASGEVAFPRFKRVILSHCPASLAQKMKKSVSWSNRQSSSIAIGRRIGPAKSQQTSTRSRSGNRRHGSRRGEPAKFVRRLDLLTGNSGRCLGGSCLV